MSDVTPILKLEYRANKGTFSGPKIEAKQSGVEPRDRGELDRLLEIEQERSTWRAVLCRVPLAGGRKAGLGGAGFGGGRGLEVGNPPRGVAAARSPGAAGLQRAPELN